MRITPSKDKAVIATSPGFPSPSQDTNDKIPIESTPSQPEPVTYYSAKRDDSVQVADPQFFVIVDPAASPEEMENAIWQNIGGHEILKLARRDLLDGINIDYSLISNLAQLYEEYNPKTIFAIEDTQIKYFAKFGLKFEKYLPSKEELNEITPNLLSPVILNDSNGITIYVKNIADNQEVEIQIITVNDLLRDTVYERDTIYGEES